MKQLSDLEIKSNSLCLTARSIMRIFLTAGCLFACAPDISLGNGGGCKCGSFAMSVKRKSIRDETQRHDNAIIIQLTCNWTTSVAWCGQHAAVMELYSLCLDVSSMSQNRMEIEICENRITIYTPLKTFIGIICGNSINGTLGNRENQGTQDQRE